MLKFIIKFMLPLMCVFVFAPAYAQEHKVIFDITSSDQKDWQTLLNNLENVQAELGVNTKMEVVAHGGGLGLLLKVSGFQTERLKRLAGKGIAFAACENTMKRKGVTRKHLYDFATTVPAGLAEIIKKQGQGWSYIKIGH